MIPVKQTIFPDEQQPMRGNCFAACVASLLHMGIDDVPHFMECQQWDQAFDQWLEQFGLAHVEVNIETEEAYICPVESGIWCIITGNTNRHPTRLHAVVARTNGRGLTWEYVHDPHPDGTFLTQAKMVMFLVQRDPSILTAKDIPMFDATDCAHPAWWRGNDHGFTMATVKLREAMEAIEAPAGTMYRPFQELRQAVYEMAQENKLLKAKLKVAENAGMMIGKMHESGKEPYMTYTLREGSPLGDLAALEDRVIMAGIERELELNKGRFIPNTP